MTETFDMPTLLAELGRDEGRRLKPYLNTVGKTTIGVGRNLTDIGISDGECDLLLEHDVARSVATCRGGGIWTGYASASSSTWHSTWAASCSRS